MLPLRCSKLEYNFIAHNLYFHDIAKFAKMVVINTMKVWVLVVKLNNTEPLKTVIFGSYAKVCDTTVSSCLHQLFLIG